MRQPASLVFASATSTTPITTTTAATAAAASAKSPLRPCRLNSHILYRIFTQHQSPLTPADLASCALVSREWASVATPVLWRSPTWTLAHMSALHTALLLLRPLEEEETDGRRRARTLVEGVKNLRLELSYSGAGWANFENEDAVWAQFMQDMIVLNNVLRLFRRRSQPLEQLTISLQLHTGRNPTSPSQHAMLEAHLDALFANLRTIKTKPGKLALAYNVSAAHLLGKRVRSLASSSSSSSSSSPLLRALAIDGYWTAEAEIVKALQESAPRVAELEMRGCAMSDALCAALVRSCGDMLQVLTVRSRASLEARQRAMDILTGCKALKTCTWVEA
ncbi:hypothetical protein HDU86_000081 [Geranomyces michiganensis]|nr:hypothetical protein HDU86_000081 [Geranomyces michiganensis]